MQEAQFKYCCTAQEIGDFEGFDTIDDIEDVMRNIPLSVVTQAPQQNNQGILKQAGFVALGTYPGHAGAITLWVRGLKEYFVKGGEKMTIKKTKKTIALKTGKKVAKTR